MKYDLIYVYAPPYTIHMSGMPGEWRYGGGWINTDSPNNHYTGLQNCCISSSVQQHLVVVNTYYTYVHALIVVAMPVDHNLYSLFTCLLSLCSVQCGGQCAGSD